MNKNLKQALLKHFEIKQARSKIECATICAKSFECISFTFEMPGKCLFYDHARGIYYLNH